MNKKIKITILTIILILASTITSFAVNNTTNNTSNTNSNVVNATKQTTKSSNANLSNLGITPYDFSGFKESKTQYSVSVPNTITEVEVYATKKDSKASITGTGKMKLKEGENAAKVVVTAENGTTKTYTINIKRLKSGEKQTTTTTKESSTSLELETLEVEEGTLEPTFNKNTYQYTINYEGSENKLNIKATASQADADVKIIGNEKLINGQNIITIIVTDSNESNATTYQIYANKNVVAQEELNKHMEDAERNYQIKIWTIRILIAVIVICIIILLILIYKKTNTDEYKNRKNEKKQAKARKHERKH